jgi:hypothetical protein
MKWYLSILILLLKLHFLLGPLFCFPSEIIWNYRSYRKLIGFLLWTISPVARHLSTQDNTNIEEMRTDFHAFSGNPTHDPRVWAGEHTSCLIPGGHCDRQCWLCKFENAFITSFLFNYSKNLMSHGERALIREILHHFYRQYLFDTRFAHQNI